MLIYEITEQDRDQIMRVLEWAEWGIYEHIRRGDVDMTDEKAAFMALWNRIALLEPSPE